MGWTSYHANNYLSNGKVDLKAECRNYFTSGLNEGFYEIVKDTMVGNTYYAAAKVLKRYVQETDSFETLPVEEQKIYAFVVLTSQDTKEYYNFSYKVMDETTGPCYYDCVGLLKYLSPTNSQYANKWRAEVRKRADEKNQLNKFPIGTQIKFSRWILTKTKLYSHKPARWLTPNFTYIPISQIHDFEIVKIG